MVSLEKSKLACVSPAGGQASSLCPQEEQPSEQDGSGGTGTEPWECKTALPVLPSGHRATRGHQEGSHILSPPRRKGWGKGQPQPCSTSQSPWHHYVSSSITAFPCCQGRTCTAASADLRRTPPYAVCQHWQGGFLFLRSSILPFQQGYSHLGTEL